MDNPFKPGDVVRLKSGGSRMTVERVGKDSIYNEDSVWCVWTEFEGRKQVVKRETFPVAVLDHAKEPGVAAASFGRTIR